MKAEVITSGRVFAPVSIAITMETEAEVEAVYAIFNHVGVMVQSGLQDGSHVKEAIEDALGKMPSYQSAHSRLCGLLK